MAGACSPRALSGVGVLSEPCPLALGSLTMAWRLPDILSEAELVDGVADEIFGEVCVVLRRAGLQATSGGGVAGAAGVV